MSQYKIFDKNKLNVKSVQKRISKSSINVMIDPDSEPPRLNQEKLTLVNKIAMYMVNSKSIGAPIILAYGAHLVKNGCAPILIRLMEMGYVQQLLTNGAGIIHDFEFAYIGKSEEDVRMYLKEGQFGLWDETGKYLNQAIKLGSEMNLGLGESVGKMIFEERLDHKSIKFPYKMYSITGKAYELSIPISSCVGIGYDIINTHPECDGAALGKTSYTDFLIFAESVKNLQNGTFLSIGSAIMAPMVMEKALSMAKNVAKSLDFELNKYSIIVNDIQPNSWDWNQGEPPKDNPAYYLRFCKSFSRMGGKLLYLCLDNRTFLHNLYHLLKNNKNQ